jgi:uncharacterized protein YecT (DUF1311 family)
LGINEIQNNINALLQNHWFTVLAIPSLGALGWFIKLFLERKLTGKPDAENIELLSKIADLKAKLDKDGTTLDELKSFRTKALSTSASIALTTAQQYTQAASQLVGDAESAEHDADWEQNLTQTDMNLLSSEKAAQADDELVAVVNSKIRELDGEDRTLFQNSQSAWQVFREMETKRESRHWEGGSIRPLMVNLRYEAITRERIAGLRSEGSTENSEELALKISKTPRNLLEHIVPGVPKGRVEDILGIPSLISGNQWYYRYKETQIQISFDDNDAANDVMAALLHDKVCSSSLANSVTDIPLGNLTLADVLAIDDQSGIEFRESMRTQEVYVCLRIGPPGAWTTFCFGALSVFSRAGLLQDIEFEWDREAQCLRTDPKDILINWMALPGSSFDVPYFDWFIK